MRHRVAGKRLNRSSGNRKALRRNLVTALFHHERIETTDAKAKAIRAQAEKLITLAKRGLVAEQEEPARGVHARRLAAGRINRWVTEPDGTVVDILEKLFEDIAPRYADRPGGYTRVYKLGPRKGDAAQMVLMELVEEQ
jgi:large subunit ribosomal protein L17